MIHYFNSQTGLPVTPNVDAGEALVKQGLAIKKEDASKALKILKEFNNNAVILANVTNKYLEKVILNSAYGTARFLDTPTGELLPRIC